MDLDVINRHNGSQNLLNGTRPEREFGGSQSDLVYTILFLCLRLLVAFISLICTFCILKSLWRITHQTLKPRILLINAMTTDIFFCLVLGFVRCVNCLEPLGLIGDNDFSCLRYIANFLTPAIQYAQVLSCFVLTLDRVYAVTAPFRYRRQAYPPCLSAAIIFFLWSCVVGLMAPVFLVSGGLARWEGPCSQMGIGRVSWTDKVRFPLVFGVSVLNFFVYACLFLFLRCRRGITKLSRTQSVLSKKSISLVLTFFSIQVSVMALYLPGPLFDILLRSAAIRLNPTVKKRTRYVFILLFTLIPVLNSAILALRIPSIKTELLKMFGRQTSDVCKQPEDICDNQKTRENTS